METSQTSCHALNCFFNLPLQLSFLAGCTLLQLSFFALKLPTSCFVFVIARGNPSPFARAQRCTLNEKSTSPLECLFNKVLKSGSGIRVAPTMSLLQSMRIQDTQADGRMRENMLRACELARGHSPTANEVTPLCESQLIQQKDQSTNYAC